MGQTELQSGTNPSLRGGPCELRKLFGFPVELGPLVNVGHIKQASRTLFNLGREETRCRGHELYRAKATTQNREQDTVRDAGAAVGLTVGSFFAMDLRHQNRFTKAIAVVDTVGGLANSRRMIDTR